MRFPSIASRLVKGQKGEGRKKSGLAQDEVEAELAMDDAEGSRGCSPLATGACFCGCLHVIRGCYLIGLVHLPRPLFP